MIVATISTWTATSASSRSNPAVRRPGRPRNTSRHGAAVVDGGGTGVVSSGVTVRV